MTKLIAVFFAIMITVFFTPTPVVAGPHPVHDIDRRLAYLEGRASVTPPPAAPVAPAPVVNVAPASPAQVLINGLGWIAAAILVVGILLALALGFLGRSVRASGGGGATEATGGGASPDGSSGRRQRFVIETATEVAVDTLVSPTKVTIRNS